MVYRVRACWPRGTLPEFIGSIIGLSYQVSVELEGFLLPGERRFSYQASVDNFRRLAGKAGEAGSYQVSVVFESFGVRFKGL
jgi:hypothetical protein